MRQTTEEAMTAREAARTLKDLEGFEDRLAARTFGLTCLVFGVAIAGIYVTYATAYTWHVAVANRWLMGVLWIPWITAGSLTTTLLWRTHALATRTDARTRDGWMYAIGCTLGFFAIAGALALAGLDWRGSAIYVIAGGVLTFGLGLVQGRLYGVLRQIIPMLAAGALVTAAGVALALARTPDVDAALIGAATVLVAYTACGLIIHARS